MLTTPALPKVSMAPPSSALLLIKSAVIEAMPALLKIAPPRSAAVLPIKVPLIFFIEAPPPTL